VRTNPAEGGQGRAVLATATALVLLAAQLAAVVGGPELPNPGSAPLTREQQIQLGLQAATTVRRRSTSGGWANAWWPRSLSGIPGPSNSM
jgi:hypothetical protein